MARIRYLKPGFFENEELADLPAVTRLLFAGLWLIADRKGRLQDRPAKIKGDLFPYDNTPVDKHLKLLDDHGFIRRYEAEGKKLIWIPTFLDHQHPHINEAASTLPRHPDDNGDAEDSPLEMQSTNQGEVSSTTIGDAPPGRKGKGKGEWVMGNREGKGNENGNGEPTAASAAGPASTAGTDWDFIAALYAQNLGGPPDDTTREKLRAYVHRLPADWVIAAINEAAHADDPGFGYLSRVLDRCLRENKPPSTLAKAGRGRRA